MLIEIVSLKDLENLAKKVAYSLKGGETLALSGNLGAGKTTFTKMLLKAAGVRKKVSSPTFVLMIPYRTKSCTYYHMDLYRIVGYKELQALGVSDYWNRKENIFIIEWAEKIKSKLPKNTIFLNFKITAESRKIVIKNAPKSFQKNIS
ncbi:MAG: tRNA (adenosine(37)-N6)-threonylcarbamoyltransferase complex ATPase subunit type 1 TsaE [Candidatus Doudnabacteria bacterium]